MVNGRVRRNLGCKASHTSTVCDISILSSPMAIFSTHGTSAEATTSRLYVSVPSASLTTWSLTVELSMFGRRGWVGNLEL